MALYSCADVTLFTAFPMVELLQAINKKQSPDFTFQLMSSPPPEPADSEWIHHWYTTSADNSLSLARLDNGFLLRFPALADFVIDGDSCTIGAWPGPETDEETLRHLLLDQVLPRVLSHHGRLVLHASAVCADGRAIALAGDTGRGKSTLAASLHVSGYPLLTDDGLLVKAEGACIKALPVYPGLRLWPQSITALFKELASCETMAYYSEKKRIRLPHNNGNGPIELAALFVLSDPDLSDGTHSIKVSQLSPRNACMELVRNSFQLDVSDPHQVKSLFGAACEVAERLPVFSLSYPRDFSCLPDVHDAILQQLRQTVTDTA